MILSIAPRIFAVAFATDPLVVVAFVELAAAWAVVWMLLKARRLLRRATAVDAKAEACLNNAEMAVQAWWTRLDGPTQDALRSSHPRLVEKLERTVH